MGKTEKKDKEVEEREDEEGQKRQRERETQRQRGQAGVRETRGVGGSAMGRVTGGEQRKREKKMHERERERERETETERLPFILTGPRYIVIIHATTTTPGIKRYDTPSPPPHPPKKRERKKEEKTETPNTETASSRPVPPTMASRREGTVTQSDAVP